MIEELQADVEGYDAMLDACRPRREPGPRLADSVRDTRVQSNLSSKGLTPKGDSAHGDVVSFSMSSSSVENSKVPLRGEL